MLKQLEVLKEEEKEFQNLKVRATVGLDYRDDVPSIPYLNKEPQTKNGRAQGQPGDGCHRLMGKGDGTEK